MVSCDCLFRGYCVAATGISTVTCVHCTCNVPLDVCGSYYCPYF